MLVMPSGRTFSPSVVNHWVSEASPGSHFRIIQHRPDHLEVLFVNKREDGDSVSARLREKFEREIKEPVQVDIRRVNSIPNDGLKFRAFVRKFQVLVQTEFQMLRVRLVTGKPNDFQNRSAYPSKAQNR